MSLPESGTAEVSFTSGADTYIRRRLLISRVFSWVCRLVTYASLLVLLVLGFSVSCFQQSW